MASKFEATDSDGLKVAVVTLRECAFHEHPNFENDRQRNALSRHAARWISKGRIEYVKLGSRVMFRPESVRALINSSVREAKQ